MTFLLLSHILFSALTVHWVKATGEYDRPGSSNVLHFSSSEGAAHTSRVLKTITEPLLWKYGAEAYESIPSSHEERIAKVKNIYTPSRNAGRAKSGRDHVRDKGLILPVNDGEEIRFSSPPNKGTDRSGEEEKIAEPLARTNLKNLRTKYVSLYRAAKEAFPQDVPRDVLNEHFYQLVEQYQAAMAKGRRARYISNKVGTYLTAQEADQVRNGFFDVRQRIEGEYEPQRPHLRLQQSISSNKSRLKRKLKVDPNDENVKKSIDRFGYSVDELMARKTGRKRRHFGSMEIVQGKEVGTSKSPVGITGGEANVVDRQLQRQEAIYQMPRFHLDLNKPAPFEAEEEAG